jgi:hypothetical protein
LAIPAKARHKQVRACFIAPPREEQGRMMPQHQGGGRGIPRPPGGGQRRSPMRREQSIETWQVQMAA